MKQIAFLLAVLYAGTAFASQKLVVLPNDTSKLYVTYFVESPGQVKQIDAKFPTVAKYKAGAHVNVYRKTDPIVKARFKNVQGPCYYVQKANGAVVETGCLFRRWRERRQGDQQEQKESTPPDNSVEDEADYKEVAEVPVGPVVSPLLLIVLAVVGVAFGAGKSFYDEVSAK